MQERSYSSSAYKYGFNGQEKDDEVSGSGNTNSATFWEYDCRLGRRLGLDPITKISWSNYSCFHNKPILMIDPHGDDDVFSSSGEFMFKINNGSDNVYVVPKEMEDVITQNLKDEGISEDQMKMQIRANVNRTLSGIYRTELEKSTSPQITNEQYYKAAFEAIGLRTLNSFDYIGSDQSDYTVRKDYQKMLFNVITYYCAGEINYNELQMEGRKALASYSHEDKKYKVTLSFIQGYDKSSFILEGEFFNKNDIINAYVGHEKFHKDHHKGKEVEKTITGLQNHLDAYYNQVKHSSWSGTSENFKGLIKANIKSYLDQLKTLDENAYKIEKGKFDKVL